MTQELKKIKYIDKLIEIAQDRRYSTAIDLWSAILLEGSGTKYVDLKDNIIKGITAKDIARKLDMKISSVYHNLKILQSNDFQFFETDELVKESKTAGRKVTQTVYRVPSAYYEELAFLLQRQMEEGEYKQAHQELTYFNLLKMRGILALYASMLHQDRVLVHNKTEANENWYEEWMNTIKFDDQIATPGILHTVRADKMKEVLKVINHCCADSFDEDKKEQHKKDKETKSMVQFSYLVFPGRTDEMKSGEWIKRKEYKLRKKDLPEKDSSQEILDCENDHETLFKYGLTCPVCKMKPPKK